MVKYTRYDHGYPTIWSKWMYPPKNVSFFKYMKAFSRGFMSANKSTFMVNKGFFFFAFGGLYLTYKISYDWTAGSKYNVSLKSDSYNYIYGPPCPKAVEGRRVKKLMTAPEK